MAMAAAPQVGLVRARSERWWYLALCVVCMIMIANFQYGWSVFVSPLHKAHGWSVSNIQLAFTIFVALETWATPFNGWLADRLGPHLGPRVVMGAGGLLVALGWIVNSYATSLPILYLGGALSGLGAGAVYCTAVGTAVKWFTDHRGLAVGLVAGGFGAGAAMTIIPIQMAIKTSGYASAFFWAGLLQGAVVLIVSQFIRNPNRGEVAAQVSAKAQQTTYSYSPHEVLTSRVFWVLYVLDVLMCAGGLIVTAYLAPIADSYHVSDVIVFMGATTLSIALIFANVMNGIARPLFGWVSDKIGLSETMAIAFALGAVAYFLLSVTGKYPWGLIVFVGMVFFCWGEIFSLFPAMCTDLFGQKYATTNSALLYTAKGAAAFLVPLGGLAASITGNWNDVLFLTTGINIVAVILVLTVLRPAAARHHATAITKSEKAAANAR
ncbi:MAG: oxalate/formate MFS antiporter [Methylovirgula sp.]|uniref:oxalate/formate MFS antiporter n=1 Tax=Methylovirgula sp. TaxID=1978224 RepID=UPI0030761A00